MFYIKIFYRILFKNIPMGILFILLSGQLLMLPHIRDFMEQKIDEIVPENTFNPHFLALIFDTDKTLIEQRFSHLPGIGRIEFLKKEKIAKEIKKTIKKLDLNEKELLFDQNHMAVKIYFTDKTGIKSQNLIRDYLKKLVGSENIVLGSIIRRARSEKYLDNLHRHRHIVVTVCLGMIFLCWFFLFLTYRGIILEEAYLIEKFQRRKRVGMKIYLSGIFSMAVIMTVLLRFHFNPHIPWPVLLQTICVLLLTRYKWERI